MKAFKAFIKAFLDITEKCENANLSSLFLLVRDLDGKG